jgi:hypothetical protein
MPAHREPTGVGQAKRGTMPRLCGELPAGSSPAGRIAETGGHDARLFERQQEAAARGGHR